MVGFANTLETTSMSIPDIPCFTPTVASQATFAGAGAGYYVREFGMDWESGSGNASRSAFGILQVQEVHMHLAMAKRRRTNVNTPNGRVGRVLRLPPLAGGLTFSPPTLQLSRGCEPIGLFMPSSAPSASASISAFAFPSTMGVPG